ncbi:MAG: PaaI family thioesterase [Haloarculaceae archaeon]
MGAGPGCGPETGADADPDAEGGPDVDPRVREAVGDMELFRWLGLEVESVDPGRATFRVPFDEKLANVSSGTLHGGIAATVIDTASAFALRSTMEDPTDASLTTTDLNVRYVRPARSEIRVTAEVVRSGRTIGVTECEATARHEGEEKVVATGGTTYRLFRGGES